MNVNTSGFNPAEALKAAPTAPVAPVAKVQKPALPKIKKGPSAPPPVCSERTKLLMAIRRFYSSKRFAKELKDLRLIFTASKIDKMETAQLKTHLQDMHFALSNRTSADTFEAMSHFGLKATERGLCSVGVDVSGVTRQLENNDSYQDSLELVRLENQDLIYVSPTKQLGMTIARSMMMAYSVNAAKALARRNAETTTE